VTNSTAADVWPEGSRFLRTLQLVLRTQPRSKPRPMREFFPFGVKFTHFYSLKPQVLTELPENLTWHWRCLINFVKLGRFQTNRGMTLLEAVVVIFSLTVLVIVMWPALAPRPHRIRMMINCINNLKQTELAFKIWEGDHNDKYPMAVSATNGGAMEAAALGNAMTVFQVMSNELITPKVLVCPMDKQRHWATNFNPLASSNVSYFVNVNVSEAFPQEVMIGDDNLKVAGLRAKSGLVDIASNTPVFWAAPRHALLGNVGLADGSVQEINNVTLANWLHSTNFTTVRLAIP